MAVIYWVSTSSQTWSTGANWSGGSAPGSSDTAVFTGKKSNVSVDGATVTGCTAVRISNDYTGSIGSSGTPLTFQTNAVTYLDIFGTGSYYFSSSGVAITNTFVNTNNKGDTAVNLKGTLTNVYALKGRLNLQSSGTVTTLFAGYQGSRGGDIYVTIQSSVTLTTVNQTGGYITSQSAFTTLNQDPGATLQQTIGNVTTANVRGTYVYQTDGGTITTLVVWPNGLCDMSQEGSTKTITNTTIHNGGTVDIRNGSAEASITFTNTPILIGENAQLLQSGSSKSALKY